MIMGGLKIGSFGDFLWAKENFVIFGLFMKYVLSRHFFFFQVLRNIFDEFFFS